MKIKIETLLIVSYRFVIIRKGELGVITRIVFQTKIDKINIFEAWVLPFTIEMFTYHSHVLSSICVPENEFKAISSW